MEAEGRIRISLRPGAYLPSTAKAAHASSCSVVLQDVQTGLALRPQWGPETTSGQALALEALVHLPPHSVVLGDRNFGVAWAACQQHHAVLLRLTRKRAERLTGSSLEPGSTQEITWQPTRLDRCGGPYPAEAAVQGRLVCGSRSLHTV